MSHEDTNETILLVEDDAIIGLAEKRTLEQGGYRVEAVVDGKGAIDAASARSDIALVLMDIELGTGMSGTDAAQAILTHRDLPIVFLTSHSEKEMVDLVRGITRYGYVLKSSGPFVLLQAVSTAFELFRAHMQAKQAVDLHRSIVSLSGEIVVRHGADGSWDFVNRRACEFWGRSEEDLLAQRYLSFVHPEDLEETRRAEALMTRSRQPIWGFVNRQRTPRGWRVVEWNSAPILDAQGTFIGHQAVGRDVTDRIQAQEALRREEAAHQAILTNITDVVAVIDEDGVNRYKSPSVEREFGWKPEELVGQSAFDTVHPDDLDRVLAAFRALVGGETTRISGRCRYRRADGDYRWISFTAVDRLRDPSLKGVLLTYRDVDQEHRTEEHLGQVLQQLSTMFESAPTGIILADGGNRIVDINPVGARLFGMTREELVGVPGTELIHPDDLAREPIEGVTQEIEAASAPVNLENRFRRKDGSYFDASVWVSRYHVPGYGATHIIQFQDITDRKQAEAQVRRLLEEKELLLKEVHHRVKNDLNLLHSFLELQAGATADEQLATSLREASRRIGVVGGIYDQLQRVEGLQNVDVVEMVQELIEQVQEGSVDVDIRLTATEAPLRLSVRPAISLGIIVNELVTNAAKYAFSGRRGRVEGAAPQILLGLDRRPGSVLRLVVRDNGRGFDRAALQDRRLGFGLSIVEALVQRHHGSLDLRNDDGATVVVELTL